MAHSLVRQSRRCLAIVLLLLAAGFALPSVLSSPAAAAGTTYLAGNACASSTTPTWVNTTAYVLYENVTVPVGCTLTIASGTVLRADPKVSLYLNGVLEANGTATDSISFDTNVTNQIWGGIQFNKTSRSSYLQYASLRMVNTGVRAVGTPLFWGPYLTHLNIDHALVGVELQGSNATLSWSRINYTTMAVHAFDGGYGGYPIIVANTITTVLSSPAIAIYATNLVQPTIQSNWITWVNGSDGANGGSISVAGQDGGAAVGILVSGGTWPIVAGNTVSQIRGGGGGAGGSPLLFGNGGRGGKGGDASGIVMANAQNSRAQTNDIAGLFGGHGGAGGAANGVFAGGPGGAGGTAIAMEALNNSATGWWFYNDAIGLNGGSAGDGGAGNPQGTGGAGGAAYGHFFLQNVLGNASNNLAQNLQGGYGGNGSVGGVGGEVGGIWVGGIRTSAILGANTVTSLTGGQGGAGAQPVAAGGNATALLVLGDDHYYNTTTVGGNTITGIAGGIGGVGSRGGSNGGSAAAIGAVYARVVSSGNAIQAITGGQGGSTGPGWTNGQGGSATGYATALTPSFSSSLDRIQSVTKGLPGSGGNPPPAAQGVGFYVLGNATFTSVASLTNGTFSSVGDFDLFLDNYTRTTTLNTTFASAKLYVGSAANLTVKNFLAVKALWPNNTTLVTGVRVAITDNGVEVYNRTSSTGNPKWIVLTNRLYPGTAVPKWNVTRINVTYSSYTFGNDPRTVNMTASQTQYFTMIDRTPPTTAMTALPTYTTTLTFTLHYSYSDGNGSGVVGVTLWKRVNGTTWSSFAIISVSGSLSGNGQYSFTAPYDGTYEFGATAVDAAANYMTMPPPANQTWTIVDTAKPGSHVTALPTWETSLSFLVSWGPNPGTTDVASYTIQYNSSGTWVAWLSATTLTSSTFTATGQTLYQFRSIARDYAGNVEPKTGNDTWTIVDTVGPTSAVSSLPAFETASSFVVTWGPNAGTPDVANYTLQFSTDGGAWVTWLIAVTNTSASFTGADGHTYAFRSLATDYAGNVELKAGNDTWTTVDTSPPSSLVASLPAYETSLPFTVSWGPAVGVTDIAAYRIEYDHGAGWVIWFGDTTATSATFNPVSLGIGSPQGAYAFRSLATDRAGNVESKSVNDTWTVVDTIAPTSAVAGLPSYETSATFAVSWNPTGATSDVESFALQVSVDGTAWATWFSGATNRSAAFAGADGHRYAFRSLATDYAGNVEAKTGNDTWTSVDTAPPASAVGPLPRYETQLTFPLNWGPSTGTTDASTYDIEVRTDGGAWTTWLSGVNNRSAVFTGADGHTYAFRSLATDYAGNAESKTGNDTFTSIDVTLPTVAFDAPEGAGVDPGTTITITFSEPMNEASVEQAFSLSPSINGAYSWNAAGTALTFTPARPLSAGTSYTVVLTTGARDLAGNPLAAVKTFTFSTTGGTAAAGFSWLDWWPLFVALAVGAIAAAIFLLRRRGLGAETVPSRPVPAAASQNVAEIDDVFLLYKDGILIKHETLRLRPDIDTDILSGMLTAVQQFVKDSFQSDDEGELNEITVGQMHLHIGRGKWLILAARVGGGDLASMNEQIRKAIQDMEDHHWDQLEDWDGDMGIAKILGPYLKRLIRGEYA